MISGRQALFMVDILHRKIFPWTVVVCNSLSGRQMANHLKTGTLVLNQHVVGFIAHLHTLMAAVKSFFIWSTYTR